MSMGFGGSGGGGSGVNASAGEYEAAGDVYDSSSGMWLSPDGTESVITVGPGTTASDVSSVINALDQFGQSASTLGDYMVVFGSNIAVLSTVTGQLEIAAPAETAAVAGGVVSTIGTIATFTADILRGEQTGNYSKLAADFGVSLATSYLHVP